jgi:putative hydrolase of the HAD superfamily
VTPRLRAVVFDLDDTLFPQSSWLAGAWRAVAIAASASHGVPADELEQALLRTAEQGTAKGGIIDRALLSLGRADVEIAPLVECFRSHAPAELTLYPGARELLDALRPHCRLGLITDGDVDIQRGKVAALGIGSSFDAVVYSDELGRERRKPDAAPFEAALRQLGVAPSDAAYVGDNPAKDVVGARRAGMVAIRVRSGEYAALDADIPAQIDVADLAELASHLVPTAT